MYVKYRGLRGTHPALKMLREDLSLSVIKLWLTKPQCSDVDS